MTVETKKCSNCYYWDKEHTSEICGRCNSYKIVDGKMIFNMDNWKETIK
ncbi:MAG: hypothetical protein IMZ70_07735 [Candidatus Atribacteria bacterium]|nr:hypothetical protein [Candidatus Atribacteria bacterium]